MKNFLLIAFMLLSVFLFGQAPQGMNYQVVVRDINGQPITNGTQVVFRFTIHDVTPNGSPVFTEDVTDTTNQLGLCAMVIGKTGNLTTVNWKKGDKYLQVEAKVSPATTFTDMGTTQLMSVPYALYAQNTPSLNQSSVNYYASTGVTYVYAIDTAYKSISGQFHTITVPDSVTTIFQSTGHVGGQNFNCWSRAVIALYVDGVYIDNAISNIDVVTDDNISSGGGNWHIIYPVVLTPGTHTFNLKVKGHIQNQCSLFIDDRGLGFSGHSIVNVTFLKN